MCLSGADTFWYLTLSEQLNIKNENLSEQFTHDYLQKQSMVNTTCFENRKLLSTESSDKYIADMSNLAIFVGI